MKLDWLTFWICALATYRITVVISRDSICKWLRKLQYIGHWAKCPFCVAPWVGSVIAYGLWINPVITTWIMLPFAFAGITVAIDRAFSADHQT